MKDEEDMLELLDEDEQFLEMEPEPSVPESGFQADSGEPEPESEPETREIEIPILYIGILAVVIIGVLAAVFFIVLPMFSTPSVPQADLNASSAGEDIFLYHNGGTPLDQNSLVVKINGEVVPHNKYMLLGGVSWPYEMGKTLRIDTTGYTRPASLMVIDTVKGSEYVLYTYGLTPVATTPPTPAPTTPVSTPEPVTGSQVPVNTTGNVTAVPVLTQIPAPGSTSPPTLPVPAVIQVPTPASTYPPVTSSQPVQMEVNTTSGMQPLTVQFSDNNNGCIINRTWDFGDGLTSDKRYPTYTYPFPGVYNTSLTVLFCDPEDNKYQLPTRNISVAPVLRQDGLAKGSGSATFLPGGKIYFTVQGPAATVRVGGMDQNLKPGDHVELDLTDGGSGEITIIKGAFLVCNFAKVSMTVNGKKIAEGGVSNININKYDQIATSGLTVLVKAGSSGAKGMINGVPVIEASENQVIRLTDLGPDSTGNLILSNQNGAGFNCRAGIGSYEVTTLPSS